MTRLVIGQMCQQPPSRNLLVKQFTVTSSDLFTTEVILANGIASCYLGLYLVENILHSLLLTLMRMDLLNGVEVIVVSDHGVGKIVLKTAKIEFL